MTFGAICAWAMEERSEQNAATKKKRDFMGAKEDFLFGGLRCGLGCARNQWDKPTGGALVHVEIKIGHAFHVGGADLFDGIVEVIIERPVANGDPLVDISGDGERAVA